MTASGAKVIMYSARHLKAFEILNTFIGGKINIFRQDTPQKNKRQYLELLQPFTIVHQTRRWTH